MRPALQPLRPAEIQAGARALSDPDTVVPSRYACEAGAVHQAGGASGLRRPGMDARPTPAAGRRRARPRDRDRKSRHRRLEDQSRRIARETAFMSITRIDRGPRLSHGVVCGNMVYLAGQVSLGASVTEQTK